MPAAYEHLGNCAWVRSSGRRGRSSLGSRGADPAHGLRVGGPASQNLQAGAPRENHALSLEADRDQGESTLHGHGSLRVRTLGRVGMFITAQKEHPRVCRTRAAGLGGQAWATGSLSGPPSPRPGRTGRGYHRTQRGPAGALKQTLPHARDHPVPTCRLTGPQREECVVHVGNPASTSTQIHLRETRQPQRSKH